MSPAEAASLAFSEGKASPGREQGHRRAHLVELDRPTSHLPQQPVNIQAAKWLYRAWTWRRTYGFLYLG
jgi:hypothetical protein